MKRASLFLLCLAAGCGSVPVFPDVGRSFTIEHGTAIFGAAMAGAREHCASKFNMGVQHLGTDRGGMLLLSRFRCVPRGES